MDLALALALALDLAMALALQVAMLMTMATGMARRMRVFCARSNDMHVCTLGTQYFRPARRHRFVLKNNRNMNVTAMSKKDSSNGLPCFCLW